MVEWISALAGENNSGFAEPLATGKHARTPETEHSIFSERKLMDTVLNSSGSRVRRSFATGC